jgi:hypothetical protein
MYGWAYLCRAVPEPHGPREAAAPFLLENEEAVAGWRSRTSCRAAQLILAIASKR